MYALKMVLTQVRVYHIYHTESYTNFTPKTYDYKKIQTAISLSHFNALSETSLCLLQVRHNRPNSAQFGYTADRNEVMLLAGRTSKS